MPLFPFSKICIFCKSNNPNHVSVHCISACGRTYVVKINPPRHKKTKNQTKTFINKITLLFDYGPIQSRTFTPFREIKFSEYRLAWLQIQKPKQSGTCSPYGPDVPRKYGKSTKIWKNNNAMRK